MVDLLEKTRTGRLHRERDEACEDVTGIRKTENAALLALADGHGARECFRSRKGAEFAVDAALACMEQEIDPEKLKAAILQMWTDKVLADLQAHPVTEAECEASGTCRSLYEKRQFALHVYGTTLLAARVEEAQAVLLQQGDGWIACIQGEDLRFPLGQDPRCQRGLSSSLADGDAILQMRCRKVASPDALFLTSDGISPEEGFYRDILQTGAIVLPEGRDDRAVVCFRKKDEGRE